MEYWFCVDNSVLFMSLEGCVFRNGDGIGHRRKTELKIDSTKDVQECINICKHSKATSNPYINGVSVPQDGGKNGVVPCYCKMGMNGWNGSGDWKSCYLI